MYRMMLNRSIHVECCRFSQRLDLNLNGESEMNYHLKCESLSDTMIALQTFHVRINMPNVKLLLTVKANKI